MAAEPLITVYTGAPAWHGDPYIKPSKRGRAEHGPGLYFTTHLATARKYAGGQRTVLQVELDPSIGWLEDAIVPMERLIQWVETRPRLRKKAEIVGDLVERGGRGLSPGLARPVTLVNLMVNYDVLSGDQGPALAAFLTELGIHASHVRMSGTEEWVVLFDPAKIRNWRRIGPDALWELAPVRSSTRSA